MSNPGTGLIIATKKFNTSKSKQDINILLLGPIGVGKSTFINALANCFVYSTLEEALKNDTQVLIPASFTYVDDQTLEESIIKLGEPDEFENSYVEGESCTKKCRSFTFPVGNRRIRLIDTPGFGDRRGFEHDQLNWQNIITFTSQYSHLNAICFLLKPNEVRLTILLRYCLQETLRWFPKAAMENIIFIFTNARSTDYREGSTSKVLRLLFDELNQKYSINIPFSRHNSFLLDNETFHCLSIQKRGFLLNEEDQLIYSRSWDHAMKEYVRLFFYIATHPPHRVYHTTAFYEAQQSLRILSIQINESISPTLTDVDSDSIKDERTKIELVCKILYRYLRANFMLPFNNSISEYIPCVLDEETKTDNVNQTHSTCTNNSEQFQSIHEKAKRFMQKIIDDDMSSPQNTDVIKTEEIGQLVTGLFDLPIHGPNIRKQFEESRTNAMMTEKRDITVNLPIKTDDSRMMQELEAIFSTA